MKRLYLNHLVEEPGAMDVDVENAWLRSQR